MPILWARTLALIIPWPLIDFTPWSVRLFLVQIAVFLIAALAFSSMPLQLAMVPRPATLIHRQEQLRLWEYACGETVPIAEIWRYGCNPH